MGANLGLHAHNNLTCTKQLYISNQKQFYGLTTITGMGRGPEILNGRYY